VAEDDPGMCSEARDSVEGPGRATSAALVPGLACIALAALTVAVFGPVAGHEFVDLDDYEYVVENPAVRGGLTQAAVRWAFTSVGYMSNWHPLTWLSHQLDVELFGLLPGPHHMVSLGLHVAAALLLLLTLAKAGGRLGPALFAAALFAIHPLHVESVAWVAERKDVLSTLIGFGAVGAYVAWARRPGPRRYLACTALLALGLLAKPMLVTVPFLLLLLDYWPLGRWGSGPGRRGTVRLILEKAPLFALAAASGVVTMIAQSRGGALEGQTFLPLASRLANASLSYLGYLEKTVWPSRLAVYYPHPGPTISLAPAALAAALLLTVTALSFGLRRRRPYLLAGWLWYAGSLAPVSGIVQVGGQAMADRYTYLPLVGIFLALGWELLAGGRRRPLRIAAATLCVALAAPVARAQVRIWRDSETLFTHALAVTGDNWQAYYCRGNARAAQGRSTEAESDYRRALQLGAPLAGIPGSLGASLIAQGRNTEALSYLDDAVRRNPADYLVQNNLGIALRRLQRPEEAAAHFQEASRLRPDLAGPRYNLALIYREQRRFADSEREARAAAALDPAYAPAWEVLATVLRATGRPAEAAAANRQARAAGPVPGGTVQH